MTDIIVHATDRAKDIVFSVLSKDAATLVIAYINFSAIALLLVMACAIPAAIVLNVALLIILPQFGKRNYIISAMKSQLSTMEMPTELVEEYSQKLTRWDIVKDFFCGSDIQVDTKRLLTSLNLGVKNLDHDGNKMKL
jgi:hypothetical protein